MSKMAWQQSVIRLLDHIRSAGRRLTGIDSLSRFQYPPPVFQLVRSFPPRRIFVIPTFESEEIEQVCGLSVMCIEYIALEGK